MSNRNIFFEGRGNKQISVKRTTWWLAMQFKSRKKKKPKPRKPIFKLD